MCWPTTASNDGSTPHSACMACWPTAPPSKTVSCWKTCLPVRNSSRPSFAPNYLRTLPLHHSQRELVTTESYTDFSFDIRPTADFLDELLKHGDGIEILEPLDLREKMRQMLLAALKRYE